MPTELKKKTFKWFIRDQFMFFSVNLVSISLKLEVQIAYNIKYFKIKCDKIKINYIGFFELLGWHRFDSSLTGLHLLFQNS